MPADDDDDKHDMSCIIVNQLMLRTYLASCLLAWL